MQLYQVSHISFLTLLASAISLAFLCSPASLQAQEEAADLDTPRGLAMGAGGRASAQSTSALAYNPANLAVGGLYHIDVFSGYAPGTGRWVVGGSVVDSMTNQNIAMGLSFRGILGNGEEGYAGYDGRVALAIPFSPNISVGISGRYLSLSQEGQSAVTGRADGEERANGFTMDAALRLTITEGLNVVALAHNFIDRDSELVPTLLGGGASYSFGGAVTLSGDLLFDMTTFDSAKLLGGVGGEVLVGGNVPLRAGYKIDAGRDIQYLSGGIGYIDQAFGVDVGVQQQIVGGKDTRVMGALRYFHN